MNNDGAAGRTAVRGTELRTMGRAACGAPV